MITKVKFMGVEWSLLVFYAVLWVANGLWLADHLITHAYGEAGNWTPVYIAHGVLTLMLMPWVMSKIDFSIKKG